MVKIDELVEEIRRNAQKYYEGNPEISDAQFDKLVDTLREVDPENPILKKTGWGFDPSLINTSRRKVGHRYGGMGSIERKPRSLSDVPKNLTTQVRLSPKLDGLSGAAWFKNGKLVMGVTRGDGLVGIDKTDKMRVILQNDGSLDKIPSEFTGAVRGEFVISHDNWEEMKTLGISGKSIRNTAAGILNKDEVTDDIKYVDFVVYKVLADENNYLSAFDIDDVDRFLTKTFNTPDFIRILASNNLSEEYLKKLYDKYCEKYPCDGVVITSDMFEKSDDMIFTYDEVAYKFDAEKAITAVTGIRWNLTRSNRLVPTLELKPVELSGATITHATAFNAKYVHDNSIGTGAEVEIMRSGEVIPDVQQVIKPADTPEIPLVCPICGESLDWIGVDVVCSNEKCGNRNYRDLQQWVSNIGKVDGLGDTLKFKFLDEIGITSIEQLYKYYNPTDWNDKGQKQRILFGKMLDKLFTDPIDPLDALCALNIPRLGKASAEKLLASGSPFRMLLDLVLTGAIETNRYKDEISKYVGQATASTIYENLDKLSRLRFITDQVVWTNSNSNNLNKSSELIKVCITGKLSMPRKKFEELLKEHGYSNSSIGKDTRYLITDNPNSGSSKNRKADELGIEKITEEEFMKLI